MLKHSLPAYRLPVKDVYVLFGVDAKGLSSKHATKALERDGSNALVRIKQDPPWKKYLRQFQDMMIVLLLTSAAIAAYLGDGRAAIVLTLLVLFNTVIGFLQEYRAERTMQALEKLVQPIAEVYRDGVLTQINSSELVPGDIVRLSEGTSIPADIRLTDLMSFSTNEFALTGESSPTEKFTHAISDNVPMANRHNLAYTGTTVATGEAVGIVIATGMNTELGRIAALSQSAPHALSPLQRELRHIATYVTYGVVVLSLVLLMIAIHADLAFKDALLFAVGFASSLIPQGLPAEVNTSLAQAAGKLSKAKALVKKLSAVETLGATHVICTDKTGTLTKNEMTVQELLVGTTIYTVTGTGYEPTGAIRRDGKVIKQSELASLFAFVRVGMFASNARLLKPDGDNSQWRVLGDPTEAALMTLAAKVGLDSESESTEMSEIRELTFDSARKRMTSIRALRNSDTGAIAYVKGAPEKVLECSTHIMIDGVVRPLTDADRTLFIQVHTERAKRALRNLAFASRPLSLRQARDGTMDEVESKLVLLGMVSMIDPLRDAVPAAMKAARDAHIKVNIVTGDFALTAQAIARQAGLTGPGKDLVVITGEELTTLSDADVLHHALAGGAIFSRVNPEDKMRIVDLVKKSGHVVAVTGDGINDAPALRHANIGVAMGIAGTDVAKQAAEVVLLDDSFSTMVGAIRQGRTIFVNIKKGVLSCFTSNAAELVVNIVSLVLASVLGIPLAINVLQILAVDLLAELFPIAALGWDKEEGETMKSRPRDPRQHILNGRSITDILWSGMIIGGLAIANYLLVFDRAGVNPADSQLPIDLLYGATTITYVTIVICQLVNIIQRRSVHGFFTRYQLSNRYFWGSIVVSVGIVLSISYIPIVATFFKSGPLSIIDWCYVGGAAAIFLAIRETQRVIHAKIRQRR